MGGFGSGRPRGYEAGDFPMTFAQIARALGVSRERVRQIHDRALRKIARQREGLRVLAMIVSLKQQTRKQMALPPVGGRLRRAEPHA